LVAGLGGAVLVDRLATRKNEVDGLRVTRTQGGKDWPQGEPPGSS
jgi:hypothetical protein